jgi:prefoldin subunit 5
MTTPPTAYGGGFYQPPVEPKQEMEMLAEEAKALKEQLEAINKRVSELKETKEK